MTKLPRLPRRGNVLEAKYTAQQMHDYARKSQADEREACAKQCEDIYSFSPAYLAGPMSSKTLETAAKAIRARGKSWA